MRAICNYMRDIQLTAHFDVIDEQREKKEAVYI